MMRPCSAESGRWTADLLIPGDVITARNGRPLPVGPARVRFVSPAHRGGRRVGWRVALERFATLVATDQDVFTTERSS